MEGGEHIIFHLSLVGQLNLEKGGIDNFGVKEKISEIIDNRFFVIDFDALKDVSMMSDNGIGAGVEISFSALDLSFFEIM
ncbi:MAG: hypothetical protein Q4E70_01305 [Candidatus Saccharibacteria bacterium]|nr:hypothetical protein [Candidatus Saccharibacteria bacterium]